MKWLLLGDTATKYCKAGKGSIHSKKDMHGSLIIVGPVGSILTQKYRRRVAAAK